MIAPPRLENSIPRPPSPPGKVSLRVEIVCRTGSHLMPNTGHPGECRHHRCIIGGAFAGVSLYYMSAKQVHKARREPGERGSLPSR